MKKNALLEIITFLLILLFVYTAVSKLIDFNNFKFVLNQTNELRPFANILAILLPLIEILTAVLLLMPSYRKIGLYFSFGIMAVFTLYVVYLIFFASFVPCACGGVIKGFTWKQHLAFNAFFTLLSMIGIWLNKKHTSGEEQSRQEIKFV